MIVLCLNFVTISLDNSYVKNIFWAHLGRYPPFEASFPFFVVPFFPSFFFFFFFFFFMFSHFLFISSFF